MDEEVAMDVEPATGLTTRLTLGSSDSASCTYVLTRLMMASANFPGFLNAEMTPLQVGKGNTSEWAIVQRFRTEAQAQAWRSSKERGTIISELLSPDRTVHEELSPHTVGSGVALSVASHVRPGMEKEYCEWVQKIQTAQSQFPGYEGTYLQQPTSGTPGLWMFLLRFKTPEYLDNWFESERRHKLLDEGKTLIESEHIHRMTSSFPGWLPIDPDTGEETANWKAAMLVLLGVQPVSFLQTHLIAPSFAQYNHAFISILLNGIGIVILTWITMPIFKKLFYNWLLPKTTNQRKVDLTGAAIIVGLYGLETVLLWNIP